MFTSQGRYFAGHKTYWHITTGANGQVVEILASVKAWDNEGRSFQSPVRSLTPSEMAHAMQSTQAHQEVLDKMIRDLYESSCASEELEKLLKQAKEVKESAAKQDEAKSGSGAVLENRQEAC